MRIDEGFIHVAVRCCLKENGWRLVAGQYPGGSDDECYALNVMDPALARDNSPDPRRHSNNKLVPDLFSVKGDVVLITEMKPRYSAKDEAKLSRLLTDRREDLLCAMRKFAEERSIPEFTRPEDLTLVPSLGFRMGSHFPRNPTLVYFLVSGLDAVTVLPPENMMASNVRDALRGMCE